MFCTKCGKEVPDESNFCPACGALLFKEEKEESKPVEDAVPDVTPSPESENVSDISEAPQAIEKDTIPTPLQEAPTPQVSVPVTSANSTLEDVIGKNAAYYLSEFKKAENGEKTKFNLAAFFLGIFFCFYRKCGDLFKKYFLIPVAILVIGILVTAISSSSLSLTLMAVGGILSAVGYIWLFVSYIRFGKNFNKEYYEHCKAVFSAGDSKKYGTSAGSAIIAVVVAVVLVSIPSLFSSGISSGFGNVRLDGEYVIIADDTGEQIYANFNWDGPNTLRLYSDDGSGDIVEASYKIKSADTIIDGFDTYSLLLEDGSGKNTEFFTLTSLDDGTYYICFSEEVIGSDAKTAMMVPLSEGITNELDNIPKQNSSIDYSEYNLYDYQNTYFSQNHYSIELLVLPNDSEFHINLYWEDSEVESGIVTPGVPSRLDGGSTIILNLNEDGSIHVVLNDSFAERLTSEQFSQSSALRSNTLKAEQQSLYSALEEKTKELHLYEDELTGSYLDEYDGIYVEIVGYISDHGAETYFLNYWTNDVQLDAIPAAQWDLDDSDGFISILFSLDEFFSDYEGVVEVMLGYDGEYMLWSEISNCQDTYGGYSPLEKL